MKNPQQLEIPPLLLLPPGCEAGYRPQLVPLEKPHRGAGLRQLASHLRGGRRDLLLIISDIQMPVLDGLEVVRRLRAWGAKVPVIIMTAYADEQTLANAAEAGVDAVLAKPFTMTELCTTAQRLVPSGR